VVSQKGGRDARGQTTESLLGGLCLKKGGRAGETEARAQKGLHCSGLVLCWWCLHGPKRNATVRHYADTLPLLYTCPLPVCSVARACIHTPSVTPSAIGTASACPALNMMNPTTAVAPSRSIDEIKDSQPLAVAFGRLNAQART
jgi:hypothetical protein